MVFKLIPITCEDCKSRVQLFFVHLKAYDIVVNAF